LTKSAKRLAPTGPSPVLDEPTNDLDLETLDLLQEMIADYNGTVIVVSHDRDFLDRTVTRTLAYEGDAHWQIYAGGYSDMVAQRGRGVDARKLVQKPDKAAKSKSGAATAEPVKSAVKLSYKHKFRLEQLPKEMAALEAQIKQFEAKLTDMDFYDSDPDGFAAITDKLTEAHGKLETCEEEWLELEMLKDAADS